MTDQHNNIFKQWLKPFAISTLSVSMLIACGVNANLTSEHIERTNITDKWVSRTDSLSSDKTPPDPVKGSYGLNKKTGKFTHPLATRDTHDSIRFDGELDYWDTQQYKKNMKIEAYYPITVEPFHTWQNIVDFDGKRIIIKKTLFMKARLTFFVVLSMFYFSLFFNNRTNVKEKKTLDFN